MERMKLRSSFKYLVLVVLVISICCIAKLKVQDLYDLMTETPSVDGTNLKRLGIDINHQESSWWIGKLRRTDSNEIKKNHIKDEQYDANGVFWSNQNEVSKPHQLINQSNQRNNEPISSSNQSNQRNHKPISSSNQSNQMNHKPISSSNQSNQRNHKPISSSNQSNQRNHKPISSLNQSKELFFNLKKERHGSGYTSDRKHNIDVVAMKMLVSLGGEFRKRLPNIRVISKSDNGDRKFERKYGNFSSRCKDLKSPFQDLFCMRKLPFLKDVKNPCWYEEISMKHVKLSCLPYFVMLGCAKCASTDLYTRLVQHPHILPNKGYLKKEAMYWSWKKFGIANFRFFPVMTFEDFTSLFDPLAVNLTRSIHQKSDLVNKLIIGDASPPDFWDFRAWPLLPQNDRLNEPEIFTPQLIQYIYRSPKFILLFRNPTDRLYSDYFFLEQGNNPESFHEAVVSSITTVNQCLSRHSERYCFFSAKLFSRLQCRIHYGCYSVFLREWLSVFEREQFYIARSEDYSEDIKTHIAEIYEFLDVEPVSQSKMDQIKSQKKSRITKSKIKSSPMFLNTRNILDEFYEKYNAELASLLHDKKYLWSGANELHPLKL